VVLRERCGSLGERNGWTDSRHSVPGNESIGKRVVGAASNAEGGLSPECPSLAVGREEYGFRSDFRKAICNLMISGKTWGKGGGGP